ncbi:MAG: tRNA (adenosine(37)-N6)-dimethylallyltransferase MiaA [bacterium]
MVPDESATPVIFLMGPTASGKTDLAVSLHEKLPVELISVDSALVYRGMNIGTAKPEPEVLARAPHHLIDIRDPTETYSAANFREDALELIDEMHARERIPLLVGGTMLYFNAMQKGLADLPDADPEVRAQLESDLAEFGLAAMHQRLSEVDPDAASRIHSNDPQRILRALEIHQITGQPMSRLLEEQQEQPLPYPVIKLVRAPTDRTVLHDRIASRFDQMLEHGFEGEVRRLMDVPGFSPALPSMRAVGYRQMIEYLLGETDFATMREKGIIATRQLAKRQFTWLRKEKDALWLDDSNKDLVGCVMNELEKVSVKNA